MNIIIRKFKSRFRFSRKFRSHHIRRGFSSVLFWILIIALSFYVFSLFETRLKPTINTFAETRARNIAVREINLAVSEQLAFGGSFDYNDFVQIDKSTDGSIEAIRTNIQRINMLQSELMLLINERIWNIEMQEVSIPIGNLSGTQLLMGRGPGIPIRLLPAGDAEVEILHSFTSAGINQTRHQLWLEITTKIEIIIPTGNSRIQVAAQVPLAETIIVGRVPDTYMNLDGTSGLILGTQGAQFGN